MDTVTATTAASSASSTSVVLSARMLFTAGERILVANRRGQAWYSLPGGNVKPGESVEEALRRGIREETGLTARTLDFVGCVEHSFVEAGQAWQELNMVFASVLPPFADIGSRKEAIDLGSVAVADLHAFVFRPAHLRTAILSWLSTRRPAWYGPAGSPRREGRPA
ncbi:NUDIX domain-containing protein [Frankia sp. Cj3]|uniref:NUDIX domain-containing protein n=1 Tax=Frankia sp. Cj3 TaxID=2880976 RepID=UPI001EF6A106|nr:NUDIX domain-containing protein [Frankia sp. Cj3]